MVKALIFVQRYKKLCKIHQKSDKDTWILWFYRRIVMIFSRNIKKPALFLAKTVLFLIIFIKL